MTTISEWLNALEVTGQVLLVPPFYENFGKRLIKSPKVYIADSGLACHLLGIETAAELDKSPFLGALFEGFLAAELAKAQANAGRRRELYYFRDQQGLEVDFVLPSRRGGVLLIEAKATRTPTPAMAAPLQRTFYLTRRGHDARGHTVDDTIAAHVAVLDAIREGNSKAAGAAMRAHLEDTERDIRSALNTRPADPMSWGSLEG